MLVRQGKLRVALREPLVVFGQFGRGELRERGRLGFGGEEREVIH